MLTLCPSGKGKMRCLKVGICRSAKPSTLSFQDKAFAEKCAPRWQGK